MLVQVNRNLLLLAISFEAPNLSFHCEVRATVHICSVSSVVIIGDCLDTEAHRIPTADDAHGSNVRISVDERDESYTWMRHISIRLEMRI